MLPKPINAWPYAQPSGGQGQSGGLHFGRTWRVDAVNTRMRCSLGVLSLLTFGLLPAHAFVTFDDFGRWPKDWLEELEPFRERSQTAHFSVAHIVLTYQIPFYNREEFEKVWPSILSLKSKGAPIRLVDLDANTGRWGKKGEDDWSNARPCVRVIAPPGSRFRWHNVEILKYGPPRPPELWSEKGELPEYVHKEIVDGRQLWVAGKGDSFFEFCWTELEIVVDGEVIDADRLELPEDEPVIDERKKVSAP